MIVKTENPIVYSNAFGDGKLKAKFKSLVGGVLNRGQQGGVSQQDTTTQSQSAPPPAPKGMSKGLKIGLIVGGSILALTIISIIIIKSKKK